MQAGRQGRQNLACEHFVTSSPCAIRTVQPWVKRTASPVKRSSHWISELYSSWNRWTECELNCDRWRWEGEKCIFNLSNRNPISITPLISTSAPAFRGCPRIQISNIWDWTKKLTSDLRPFHFTIYPPRAPFLLFSRPLTPGCVGWDGCFLPDFSFASELGMGIITCLYDQLPDYSPEKPGMSETGSLGLCFVGILGLLSCLHTDANT